MFGKNIRITTSGRIALAATALAGVAAVMAPAMAHHSTAMFTWGDASVLKGLTVDRWDWTNPHVFIYAHDSKGTRWALEGMSPSHLSRAGWSKRSLVPGEKIDVTYYKMRDGSRGGFNVTVTKADGTVLEQLPVRR